MSAVAIELVERQRLNLAALRAEAARLRERLEWAERTLVELRKGREQIACAAHGKRRTDG